jgi:hypothetical protein
MDLASLYNLLNSFTDEQRHLERTAMLTDDPSKQAEIEKQVRAIAAIVTDIRGEVLARDLPGTRSIETAQEFEAHLRRILKAHARMTLARSNGAHGTPAVIHEIASAQPGAAPGQRAPASPPREEARAARSPV